MDWRWEHEKGLIKHWLTLSVPSPQRRQRKGRIEHVVDFEKVQHAIDNFLIAVLHIDFDRDFFFSSISFVAKEWPDLANLLTDLVEFVKNPVGKSPKSGHSTFRDFAQR